MTNNKAIEILNALAWVQGGPDREETITAILMAIEALSAKPIRELAEIEPVMWIPSPAARRR